jgi:hypothetical protein
LERFVDGIERVGETIPTDEGPCFFESLPRLVLRTPRAILLPPGKLELATAASQSRSCVHLSQAAEGNGDNVKRGAVTRVLCEVLQQEIARVVETPHAVEGSRGVNVKSVKTRPVVEQFLKEIPRLVDLAGVKEGAGEKEFELGIAVFLEKGSQEWNRSLRLSAGHQRSHPFRRRRIASTLALAARGDAKEGDAEERRQESGSQRRLFIV